MVAEPLTAALGALLGVDPVMLDNGELAEAVVQLHRQQSRLAAATTRLTAALEARRIYADDGSRSCRAWVAHRCRLPVGQARAESGWGARCVSCQSPRKRLPRVTSANAMRWFWRRWRGARPPNSSPPRDGTVDDARRLSWPDFCRAVARPTWRRPEPSMATPLAPVI